MKKYYLVYKITNKLNNMIYIGCHVTTNIKDKYMGSGTNIRKAIKEYGLENFDKSVLYCFDNETDMLNKEAELVNKEFIAQNTNYNIILGGGGFLTLDTVCVKDKDDNYFRIHKTDPRYLSGEFISIATNMVNVIDKNGNILKVNKNDKRYLNGELVSNMLNLISTKDKDDKILIVNKQDPRYLSGELVGITKNLITVKDKNGNTLKVNINDERYLNGELVHLWKDRKHSKETKNKIGLANSLKLKGTNNPMFGKCWIYNLNLKENKQIKKEELENYLSLGWLKGRKQNMKR